MRTKMEKRPLRHKIVLAMIWFLGLNIIFTVTPNVSLIDFTATAVAEEDVSKRDKEGETQEISKEARSGIAGFWDSIVGFFNGVYNWIADFINTSQAKIQSLFGFENGEGPQAVFGGAFYLLIILVSAFVIKFIYNIIRDSIKGTSGGTANAERYRKPEFRKKSYLR